MIELHIDKQDLRVARLVDVAPLPLASGAARLRLNLFALTSNNITYAAMGAGSLGYWDFFPGPEGWGRPPCWGFATVVRSNAVGLEEGARFYGYFPIGETLDVTPVQISPRGFTDGASHRNEKAAVYNQYFNTANDPAYDAAFEPEQTLFRALYATGWWAADCVQLGHPRTVVFSSASSKTALATAHRLRRICDVEMVALTSARHEGFVRDSALYDRVLTYDKVALLASEAPVTYVDFLGRESLTSAVHGSLGSNLVRSILIGATDWLDKPGGVRAPLEAIVGPQPEFFFVPAYATMRLRTNPELHKQMQGDLRAFYDDSRELVHVRSLAGANAVLASWSQLAAGGTSPQEGLVLAL
jgi:hypothetical protein